MFPTPDPSNDDQPETAPSPDAESQPSSGTNEANGSRPRTRVFVYPRAELRAEQSGAAAEPGPDPAPAPKTESKAEPEPKSERPSYSERARLNATNLFYRDTFLGAFKLSRLYRLSYLQDGEEETPQRKDQVEFFRPQYLEIADDLKRFDQLTRIEKAANAPAVDQADATSSYHDVNSRRQFNSPDLVRSILATVDGRSSTRSGAFPFRLHSRINRIARRKRAWS